MPEASDLLRILLELIQQAASDRQLMREQLALMREEVSLQREELAALRELIARVTVAGPPVPPQTPASGSPARPVPATGRRPEDPEKVRARHRRYRERHPFEWRSRSRRRAASNPDAQSGQPAGPAGTSLAPPSPLSPPPTPPVSLVSPVSLSPGSPPVVPPRPPALAAAAEAPPPEQIWTSPAVLEAAALRPGLDLRFLRLRVNAWLRSRPGSRLTEKLAVAFIEHWRPPPSVEASPHAPAPRRPEAERRSDMEQILAEQQAILAARGLVASG